MKNLNLLFNKTYYSKLTVKPDGEKYIPDVTEMNKALLAARFSQKDDYTPREAMVSHHFLMTVCYPGLLIGIGNTHDSGTGDEEISVGFSFDYVTGQPYIPGSTVKGILRSHFKDHPEVIMSLCGQDRTWVKELEKEIFENTDVFFDAVLYSGNPEGKLLDAEFITPHKSATENPIPIKLVKILPEVRFEFRFRLKDMPHMKSQEKVELFQRLLALFGVGAKTNVGFGILKADETNGAPYQKPVSANDAPGVRFPQQRNQQRPAAPLDPAEPEGRKCPQCGKWNKRFNPHTGKENWKWTQGICFSCGGKL